MLGEPQPPSNHARQCRTSAGKKDIHNHKPQAGSSQNDGQIRHSAVEPVFRKRAARHAADPVKDNPDRSSCRNCGEQASAQLAEVQARQRHHAPLMQKQSDGERLQSDAKVR